MEEIISLLVILAIGIFKAVNKKLERSGKKAAPAVPEFVEEELEPQVYGPQVSEPQVPRPQKVEPAPVRTRPAARVVLPKQEEKPVKREKIDPKKLVVYSEIMKPKYNE